ncbi:hypothetical protein NG895_09420 [Aeoliella sp. ICT_H6.2]|uniref:Uncharacterized protein n=1 Tax=Aeoliella straminimaris TaxID=2954799 RepID=A0A9X2JFW6_9BACT|nr:hypothetical protein [Aeoliella straminimaris]MCO6044126.1 hypothetical protein [Aeoliella straminimaris]
MKRSDRLQSAVLWLKDFEGKNVLRSYCKRYGVDWRCAAIELRRLGVELDSDYLSQREQSDRQNISKRRQHRESRSSGDTTPYPIEYESIFDAYLVRDFAALHAMECERDGVEPGSTYRASE